jgi:putative ABC transport system ATP-binding protein
MVHDIAVRASDIRKEFRIGDRTILALTDVDLEVVENEFVALEGPSGAGKTTLLNIIGALDNPSSGEIRVFRQNLANQDEEYRAAFRCANIGFVFQNYNLISTLTTAENIAFPMELAGWGQEPIQDRTASLLEMVELAERANHFPSQLSGGEQQRAAFARALANSPPLLLVDEPTANLDKKTGGVIAHLLKTWKGTNTILVATHDQGIIALADRKLHLREGKLVP